MTRFAEVARFAQSSETQRRVIKPPLVTKKRGTSKPRADLSAIATEFARQPDGGLIVAPAPPMERARHATCGSRCRCLVRC